MILNDLCEVIPPSNRRVYYEDSNGKEVELPPMEIMDENHYFNLHVKAIRKGRKYIKVVVDL